MKVDHFDYLFLFFLEFIHLFATSLSTPPYVPLSIHPVNQKSIPSNHFIIPACIHASVFIYPSIHSLIRKYTFLLADSQASVFLGLDIMFVSPPKMIFSPLGTMPEGEVETVEAHKNSRTHAEKKEQFQLYKRIYLEEIRPCLLKDEELRKMAETISSSSDIGLDLDRLETPMSKVKERVRAIEASLDWKNTRFLQSAVKELEARLQEISILLEEGIFRIHTS